jgi:hypothetical protein
MDYHNFVLDHYDKAFSQLNPNALKIVTIFMKYNYTTKTNPINQFHLRVELKPLNCILYLSI